MWTQVWGIRWPDEIAGLPVHPLVVHAAVVLLPLAAFGIIVMASSGARSKRYSPAVLFVATVGALSAFIAQWSGGELRAELGLGPSDHFKWGQYLPWVALLLLVMGSILALMDRQNGGRRNAVGGMYALLCSVVAVATVALTVYVGHLGAELVWG